MRLITDHLLAAVAVAAVIVLTLFYELAAGYAVDPSFVSVTVVSSAATGATSAPAGNEGKASDPKKSQALAVWIGAHAWGWGRGTPKQGFGPDELVLELQYPNGSHAKMTVQKETICQTGQDGLVWRLLTKAEYSELRSIFAD
jgi:hypothetical protein